MVAYECLQVLADMLVGCVRLGLAPSNKWMLRHAACLAAALTAKSEPASKSTTTVKTGDNMSQISAGRRRLRSPLSPGSVAAVLWAYGELTPEPPYTRTRFRPARQLVQHLTRCA